jgi:hypothetical protein
MPVCASTSLASGCRLWLTWLPWWPNLGLNMVVNRSQWRTQRTELQTDGLYLLAILRSVYMQRTCRRRQTTHYFISLEKAIYVFVRQ